MGAAGQEENPPESLDPPPTEEPVLKFQKYHIGLHLLLRLPKSGTSLDEEPQDRGLDNYERDMLGYASRNSRPFITKRLPSDESRRLIAVFPGSVSFFAGELVELRRNTRATDKRVVLDVRGFVTVFQRSDTAVLHITFAPASSDIDFLNEYDLIKFLKLWEGGERVTEPVYFLDGPTPIGQWTGWPPPGRALDELDPNEETFDRMTYATLLALAKFILPSDDPAFTNMGTDIEDETAARLIPYSVGTLDLHDDDREVKRLIHAAAEVIRAPDHFSKDEGSGSPAHMAVHPDWPKLVALGGVIQGLLDFRDITIDELRDVFLSSNVGKVTESEPDGREPRSIVALHKGTLLSFGPWTPRADEWPTVVSPYLAIPHGTALYNEERARSAEKNVDMALAETSNPPDISVCQLKTKLPKIKDARRYLRVAEAQLIQFVPNVYHYPSERGLYEDLHAVRTIADLQASAVAKLAAGRGEIEYREKRHAAVIAIISLILGIAAAVEGYFIKYDHPLTSAYAALAVVLVIPALTYAWFSYWRLHH